MPARLADIQRLLKEYGVTLTEKAGAKQNWRLIKVGYRPYPIPAHNGLREEISDVYIAGLCRHFDLDKKEFVQRLRGRR